MADDKFIISTTCKKYKEYVICYSSIIISMFISFLLLNGTRLRSNNDGLQEPDYGVLSNWAARPDMKDGADYVAAGCGENRQNKGAVADTFWIYPTSFFDDSLIHAHTQDAMTNYVVDNGNLPLTASAFNSATRVFVPRYRSVSQKFQDSGQNENETTDNLKLALALATKDVINAFEYYLKNLNNNRPFLIGGHSQGTIHATALLNHLLRTRGIFMEGKFIAAYLIGNTVEETDIAPINNVHICQNSTDTNCYLSYNVVPSSIDSIAKSSNSSMEKDRHWWIRKSKTGKIVCVNPLTWKHDHEIGGFDLHLGSTPLTPLFLTKLDKHFVKAWCSDDGVLFTKLKDPNKNG